MAKNDKEALRLANMAAQLMMERKNNCAEAMVIVMAERYGFDAGLSKMATPFGGGISANADLCGLLTGGLMVIGQLFGRTKQGDKRTKERCYVIGSQYYEWFMGRFGRCTDLKGNPRVEPFDDCFHAATIAVPYLIGLIDKNLKKKKR